MNPSIGFAGPACRQQHLVPIFKSGSRGSNSDSPAPKAGGLPTSLDPEWLRRQDSNLRMAWLTARCLTSLATPHRSGSSRRNRTAALTLMRGALSQLSYRASKPLATDRRELARKSIQSPLDVVIARIGRDDRKNLRHNLTSKPAARIQLATSRLPIECSAI